MRLSVPFVFGQVVHEYSLYKYSTEYKPPPFLQTNTTIRRVCVFLSTGVENNFAFNIAFTCAFIAMFSSNFSRELALEIKCFIYLLVSNVNRV